MPDHNQLSIGLVLFPSSGSPASADPALTSSVSASLNGLYKQRRTQIERIVVSFSLPRYTVSGRG